MALEVLDNETRQMIASGPRKIIIRSTLRESSQFGAAIMELQHASARHLALEKAPNFGISNPRCGMPEAPYPVDEEGEIVSRPGEQVIYEYRVEVPVMSKAT